MVPRRFVLLVRRVVLFVDDDEPEVFDGREHGGAGADDEIHVASSDPVPLIMTLAVGHAAVLNRHAIAERGPELRGHLRRQRDLGDEHQDAASEGDGVARQPHVQLRLAAAGHAVQQRRVKALLVGQRGQRRERGLLIRGELAHRLQRNIERRARREGIAVEPLLLEMNEAAAREPAERAEVASPLAQRRQSQRHR